MMQRKRLFVGGLFSGVTKDDLVGKLRRFGNVISVEIKQVKNQEDEITNTFAFVDIDITEDNLPKCIKVYSNTLWKGKEFFIQVAKESFLSRLKREQAEKQLKQDKLCEPSLPSQRETVSEKLASHTEVNVSQTINSSEKSQKKVNIQQGTLSQNKRKRTKFDSSSDSDSDDEEEAVCRGLPMFKGLQNTSNVPQRNSNSESESVTKKHAPNTEIPLKSKRKKQHCEENSDNAFKESQEEYSRPTTSILDRLENFSSVWRNDNDDDSCNNAPLWKTSSKPYKRVVSRTNQGDFSDNEEISDVSYKKKKKKFHLSDEVNKYNKDTFTSVKRKIEQNPNEIPLLKNKLKEYKNNAIQDIDEDINYKDINTHFSKKQKKRKIDRTSDITNETSEISFTAYKEDKKAHLYKNSSEQDDSSTKKKKSKQFIKDLDDSSFSNNWQREESFQTTSKYTSTNTITKKHEEANRKRIETLKQKQSLLTRQKNAIKLALTTVDSPTAANKKIKFQDEETESHNNKVWDSYEIETSKKGRVKPKSTMTLFEDEETDEESSAQLTFQHKTLYDSTAGLKMLELESRFGGDDRFKMNEKFLEDFEDEEDNENVEEDTTKDAEFEKEKEKNIQLLSTILGDTSPKKSFHFKDIQALRYDPEIAEHEKFEIKAIPETEIKKKKKKQVDEEEKPLPEVTTERFYEVVPDLKQLLTSDTSSFSLLKAFGNKITDEEEATPYEYSEKKISKETAAVFSHENPFQYDSSDEEDTFTERTTKKFLPEKNNSPAEDQNSKFFFGFGDSRLKEGVSFFQQKESCDSMTFTNWKEIRHQLNKNIARRGKTSIRKRLTKFKRKRNH